MNEAAGECLPGGGICRFILLEWLIGIKEKEKPRKT
jgi:hypothetical protein